MSGKGGTPMTSEAASRIQSSEAKQGGGKVESGGFASRAQVRWQWSGSVPPVLPHPGGSKQASSVVC